jgi:hypothetical protein
MTTHLLLCTPSGMAVVVRNDAPQAVRDAIELFSVSAGEIIAIGKASEAAIADTWLEHVQT